MKNSNRQKATMVETDNLFLKLRDAGVLYFNPIDSSIVNLINNKEYGQTITYRTDDKTYLANSSRVRKLFLGLLQPGQIEEKRKYKKFNID